MYIILSGVKSVQYDNGDIVYTTLYIPIYYNTRALVRHPSLPPYMWGNGEQGCRIRKRHVIHFKMPHYQPFKCQAHSQKGWKIPTSNAITGDWLKVIAIFSLPFCSKFYPLSKKFRPFFMILPVESAIAPANALYQMANIVLIGS